MKRKKGKKSKNRVQGVGNDEEWSSDVKNKEEMTKKEDVGGLSGGIPNVNSFEFLDDHSLEKQSSQLRRDDQPFRSISFTPKKNFKSRMKKNRRREGQEALDNFESSKINSGKDLLFLSKKGRKKPSTMSLNKQKNKPKITSYSNRQNNLRRNRSTLKVDRDIVSEKRKEFDQEFGEFDFE